MCMIERHRPTMRCQLAVCQAKKHTWGMSVVHTLVALSLFAVAPAFAQDASGNKGTKAANSKLQVIDFEEDTIEGDLSRPDGEYIEARRKVQHSNLIRVREEFKASMLKSVGEL